MEHDVAVNGDDEAGLAEGAARRQRSDAALNRTAILSAARNLLTADRDATVGQIAKAAGVGRGTVHRHFATREELIDAVRRQARDDAVSEQGEDRLRADGQLVPFSPARLAITEVLNKVPPFQIGEQIVAEAERLPGVSAAAIYVVDLDGETMQRLAGSPSFPEQITVPLAVGPEIPGEGVTAIRQVLEELLPGTTVAPLLLRGRALGVLLGVGATAATEALEELAVEAAVAMALAPSYTDHIDQLRRVRPTSPAAEIQQNLLPPRIVRVGGAILAGNVIPGYEIGGDWFDYAENRFGAWLAIVDSDGNGPRAAGLGAVTLGAFRSVRRTSTDPAECLLAMHDVLCEMQATGATRATVGLWNAPASSFSWITAGPQVPYRVTQDGALQALADVACPELGTAAFSDRAGQLEVSSTRVVAGERLLLLSDGILAADNPTRARLEEIRRAVTQARFASAPATVRAIEDLVREAHPDQLEDDATMIVLSPSGRVNEPTGR